MKHLFGSLAAVVLLSLGCWFFSSLRPATTPRGQTEASAGSTPGGSQPSQPGVQSGASTGQQGFNASNHVQPSLAGRSGASGAAQVAARSVGGAGSERRRAWDDSFLEKLHGIATGDPIRFELVGGETAAGNVEYVRYADNQVVYVSGRLTSPEAGRFFFQKQSLPGVAGAFVGVVEFPASERACRIEPAQGGGSDLVERPLNAVVCLRLPMNSDPGTNQVEEIPPLKPGDFPSVPIPPYQKGIAVLESLPGATAVIYLDFQGGYTPTWGGIKYDRPNVNNAQIRDVWVRVAEDYMPFKINVTTDLSVYQAAPENSRQRVIVTPTTTAAPGAGGVAYMNSFNWTGDTPCWVFITSGQDCAEAASHEAGHTLGLGHDGQINSGVTTEYYGGQGSGATSWAPIMGVAYGKSVSQWSKGEYKGANNLEDDLAIIVTANNAVDYRDDDTGNRLATSRWLELYPGGSASGQGVIERTGDEDAFQFTTGGGLVSLRANPVAVGPNLAVKVTLCDANDTVLASDNPQATVGASITTNLPAGTYTFRVAGAGRNDPLTTGFSSYGSLGYYSITGSVANPLLPDRFAIPENVARGTIVGTVSGRIPTDHPLSYAITSGNTGGTFAFDSVGTLRVVNNSLLDYETLARATQLPVQFELFASITDLADGTATEVGRRVVVAVTNVNEAPSLSGFTVAVLEGTQPGTVIGKVKGSDPDAYTLLSYSIVAGNSNGLFAIDAEGVIAVATEVTASAQRAYQLTVVASDQTPPTPLMATSLVGVTVVPNVTGIRPGTIAVAVYTNIAGNLVSALTNTWTYPLRPAEERQMTSFEMDWSPGDNYGAVARGYLMPPASGSYTFWIASDDNSELWLGTSTNPATMQRIAGISGDGSWANSREWDKFPSQRSASISLASGQAYYIEARMKEGTGGDNLAVAWESLANGISRDVIPGRHLAPYRLNYVPRPTGFTVNLHRDAITGSRLGRVTVYDANTNDTQLLTITSGNESGIFSLDPVTGVLRVADQDGLFSTALAAFALTVQATDNGTPPLAGSTQVSIRVVATNAIMATGPQQEIWNNIGNGTTVGALTTVSRYPKRPDALRPLTAFDSGSQDYGDNYGSRIRCYLKPPSSGAYTFFVSSDDASILRFGPATNPASAYQIASLTGYSDYGQWGKASSQKSAPITLVAGQQYYLETLHKEGGGKDHVEVAWTGPGIAGTNIIAGSYLSPVDINFPPDFYNSIALLSRLATNGTTVTRVGAGDSALDTLAFRIVSGNVGNSFAIKPDTAEIIVADNTTFGSFGVSEFYLVVQAQDSGYGGLYPLKSTFATVHVVVTDDTPPFVWSGAGADANWSSGLNWQGTAPGNNSRLFFTGSARQTNSNNAVSRVGPVSFESGGFAIGGSPVELLAGLSSAGDNVWGLETALRWPEVITNLSGTLTLAGAINNNSNELTVLAYDRVVASGMIDGEGGLVKSGPGTLVLAHANNYTGRTLVQSGVLAVSDPEALALTKSIELADGAVLDARGISLSIPFSQSLNGTGRVLGRVSVSGSVSPGAPVGVLEFGDDLTLSGKTWMDLAKTNSKITNDMIRVAGSLRFGGLMGVRFSGEPLRLGDTIKLFEAAAYEGTFGGVLLPPLAAPLKWDTSQLGGNGTLMVSLQVVPRLLPAQMADGNLSFQFEGTAGVTYELQSADSPFSANWLTVNTLVGSNGAMSIRIPVDYGTNRFFRLRAY